MYWVFLFCIVYTPKVILSWPIGAWSDTSLAYDLTNDYIDNFYGPWSLDYLRSGRSLWSTGLRSAWPLDRYGGSLWSGDSLDPLYPAAYGPDLPRSIDTYYSGYPKTTEVSKENYVRDHPFGGTEVGIRDSVAMRNGPWRSGVSRSYPYYLPPYQPRGGFRGLDRNYNSFFSDYDFPSYSRRPYPLAMSAARPSSLKWGGDFTYLRR